MLNETYKNVLFGVATIVMLLSSIKHSKYITEDLIQAEEYYHGFKFGIVITCLFANVCLGIFSFFILGNLNDFIHKMCVNLIGASQKLRVLGILMLLSLGFYSACNFSCYMVRSDISKIGLRLAITSFIVTLAQCCHIITIHLLHPDLFCLGWAKRTREYDKSSAQRIVFI